MKLENLNQCPICNSIKIFKVNNIKSNIKEIKDTFDLIKCQDCSHRFISKIPDQLELNKLYEIDSPLVFGGTIHELNQKKKFYKE